MDGGPVFSGNGIPDAMEFKLLETVLKDATLDLGFEGGVMNWHVYQDWRHNLAQARADFAGAPGAFQRAVAAYMTIGDYGHTRMVVEEVWDNLGIVLDAEPYSVKSSRTLGALADADNDGVSNLKEWQGAEDLGEEEDYAWFALAKYAFAESGEGEGEGEGEDCQPCPNHDCIVGRLLILNPGKSGVEMEYSCSDCATLAPGTLTLLPYALAGSVKAGSRVSVSIGGDGSFDHWSAPGLLIDGSYSPAEDFVMPASTSAVEARYSVSGITHLFLPASQIPKYVKLQISGEDAGLARRTGPGGGYIGVEVWARTGKPVAVSFSYEATSNPFGLRPAGWYDTDTRRMSNSHTDIIPRTVQELQKLEPRLYAGIFSDIIVHTVKSVGGGNPYIKAGGALSGAAEFLGELALPRGIMTLVSSAPLFRTPPGTNYTESEVPPAGESVNFTHYVQESFILTLPETPCQGYATADPAKKYYPHPPENGRGTVVAITAHSLPGYAFTGWEGDGMCWTGRPNPDDPPTSWPTTPISEAQVPTIYVEMDDAKTISPVFEDGIVATFHLIVVQPIAGSTCPLWITSYEEGGYGIEIGHSFFMIRGNQCGRIMLEGAGFPVFFVPDSDLDDTLVICTQEWRGWYADGSPTPVTPSSPGYLMRHDIGYLARPSARQASIEFPLRFKDAVAGLQKMQEIATDGRDYNLYSFNCAHAAQAVARAANVPECVLPSVGQGVYANVCMTSGAPPETIWYATTLPGPAEQCELIRQRAGHWDTVTGECY